jgi:hypothetical protein
MIRAVGMSRRQVRLMIRYESVVPRCFGASFGSRSGVLLALIAARRSITRHSRSDIGHARRVRDRGDHRRIVAAIFPHVRRAAQRARGAAVRVAHEPSLDSPHRLSAGAGRAARVGAAALVEVVLMALVRDLAVRGRKLAWIDR